MSGRLTLELQWSAGQFSDGDRAHHLDARTILRYAQKSGVHVAGGSEAQDTARNTFLAELEQFAPLFGFDLAWHPGQDCWLAVARTFGKVAKVAVDPVIPAAHGPARLGGHGPRGILRVSIDPHDIRMGKVRVGASHWLTKAADPDQHRNELLDREIGAWARRAGAGSALAFYMGDTNHDDQHVDVFDGQPLTTCWDELHKHPTTEPTHGDRGPTLDVIASYDRDGRVTCAQAHALDDADLSLFSDHNTIRATYIVRPRGGA